MYRTCQSQVVMITSVAMIGNDKYSCDV